MKTTLRIAILCGALFLIPAAKAAIYTGSWKNTTFGSTGALKIDLTLKDNRAKGSLDIDGNVFGGADPPPIPFNFPFDSKKPAKFKISNTILGTLSGSYATNGDLSVTITKTPGGFPEEARVKAKINLKLRMFTATYEIDDNGALFAEGTAEAHVPTAPIVKAPSKVNVTSKTGKATAKVTSNTKIVKIKASSPDGATVNVTGNNPYTIKAGKLKKPVNRVKFTVTNADGLKTTKTIKFVRTDLKKAVLESMIGGTG